MNPFEHLIKLETSATQSPDGLRYVNQLAGVSAEMIASLGDGEIESKAQVWAKIKAQAWERFKIDLQDAIADKVIFADVLDEVGDVTPQDVPNTMQKANTLYGVRFTVVNAKFCKLDLKGVILNTSGGDVEIKLHNLQTQTDEVIYTGTVEAGIVEVEINKTYYADRNRIDLVALVEVENGMTLHSFYTDTMPPKHAIYQGVNIGIGRPIMGGNLSYNGVGDTGVAINARLSGDIEAFIEAYAEQFAPAAWYLHGLCVVNELLNSHRLNIWTTLSREMAEDNYKELLNRYEATLRKAAKAAPMPKNLQIFDDADERQGYDVTSNV